MKTVNQFLDAWLDNSLGTKPIFHDLLNNLLEKEKVNITFSNALESVIHCVASMKVRMTRRFL